MIAAASFHFLEMPIRRGALRGWRGWAATPVAVGATGAYDQYFTTLSCGKRSFNRPAFFTSGHPLKCSSYSCHV